MLKTKGIHHISSIVGHAQRNVDFYAGVLGYRLVKKTLNYDDLDSYHLYYGNQQANSGLITTFPMVDGRPGEIRGGQVGVASYGVREQAFDFWKQRLKQFNIKYYLYERFNHKRLAFEDLDGLQLELIETTKRDLNTWSFNGVEKHHALIGIESAILYSQNPDKTLALLTNLLGYQLIDEDEEMYLLEISDNLGGRLELSKQAQPRGLMGVGVVHHIAFSVEDDEIEDWLKQLKDYGLQPTEIKDRKYFKSIYFREPGGILIELATKGPGMLVDDNLEQLGERLMIPDHYQNEDTSKLENLMPLEVKPITQLEGYGYRDRYEYEHLQQRETIKQRILDLKAKSDLTESEKIQLQDLKNQYRNKGEL